MNRLAGVLAWLRRRAEQPGTEVHVVQGFRVELTNNRPDVSSAMVLERLGDALDCIARYAPVRFAHMRRDVPLILVERFASRGAYLHGRRAILTELTFLARRDIGPAVVAASVLHEGMHARTFCLARRMAGTQPAREERICRQAELAFGRALPAEEGRPVIARAVEALALGDYEVAPRFTDAEGMAAVARADAATRAAAPPRGRAATP